MAHDLLSPKRHVDKVYYTRVAGCLTQTDCKAFEAGMTVGDLACLPAGLEILSAAAESEAYVTLHGLSRGAFRFLTENELERLRGFDNPTKNVKCSPKTQ